LPGKNIQHKPGDISWKEFISLKGIGQAKAIKLTAALELGRRRKVTNILIKTFVRSSHDIAQLLRAKSKYSAHEKFGVTFLNKSKTINQFQFIRIGGQRPLLFMMTNLRAV
jgi:DNA repair protein RadC